MGDPSGDPACGTRCGDPPGEPPAKPHRGNLNWETPFVGRPGEPPLGTPLL